LRPSVKQVAAFFCLTSASCIKNQQNPRKQVNVQHDTGPERHFSVLPGQLAYQGRESIYSARSHVSDPVGSDFREATATTPAYDQQQV